MSEIYGREASIVIGAAVPVVIYFALGERSAELLDRLKTWMARNNAVIMRCSCSPSASS